MSLNDFATQFWDTGYFGAYPTDEYISVLKDEGFQYIIKLNLESEKNISKYPENLVPIIHYPIKDNNVPQDWDKFSSLINFIVKQLRDKIKIFIHCKGGHGRSCILIACIIYVLYENMNARESIEYTIKIHNQRTNLSDRWKEIKSPLTKTQYVFLYKFLNPICILKSYNTGYQAGFSGSSLFEIETELGIFSNIDAAFQTEIRTLETKTYDELEIMTKLTKIKFETYKELIPVLTTTGIRKIYDYSRYAFGNNLVGKSLVKIREEYQLKYFMDNIYSLCLIETNV
jgi:hypothetical protein